MSFFNALDKPHGIEFFTLLLISETASKLAMNVWNQRPDLYFQIHNEGMKLGPKMKKDNLIKLLDKNGFDAFIPVLSYLNLEIFK